MPHAPQSLIREYWPSLLIVMVVLAVAMQMRGAGIVLGTAGAPAVAAFVVSVLLLAITKPASRRKLTVLSVIVGLTVVAVYGIFRYRIHADAVDAQRIAQALVEYKRRAGSLPQALADLDPATSDLATRLRARLWLKLPPDAASKEVVLQYRDAWGPWTLHQYDFGTGRWEVVLVD